MLVVERMHLLSSRQRSAASLDSDRGRRGDNAVHEQEREFQTMSNAFRTAKGRLGRIKLWLLGGHESGTQPILDHWVCRLPQKRRAGVAQAETRQSCRLMDSRSCSALQCPSFLVSLDGLRLQDEKLHSRSTPCQIANGCCPSRKCQALLPQNVMSSEYLAQVPRTAAAGKAFARTMAVASVTSGQPCLTCATPKNCSNSRIAGRFFTNVGFRVAMWACRSYKFQRCPSKSIRTTTWVWIRGTALQEHRSGMC